MSGQKTKSTYDNIGFALVLISFISAVLFPPLQFNGVPKIEFSDIAFPILSLLVLSKYQREVKSFVQFNRIWLLGGATFFVVVILSIVLVGKGGGLRDWFEPIKYIKLFSFIFFFYIFLDKKKFYVWIKVVFLLLIGFNLLHYFDVFNFNDLVSPFYTASHHLDTFGLNSIGQPATKRMIGTAGNANNNGVMFLTFFILFISEQKKFRHVDLIFPILACFSILATQSRTALIGMTVLILFFSIVSKENRFKFLIYLSLFSIAFFYVLKWQGNSYLGTVSDVEQLKRASAGRTEQWENVLEQSSGHWNLGHGVDKELMDSKEIYAESEYFLILFRYGLFGVLTFLSIGTGLFIMSLKRLKLGTVIPGAIILLSLSGVTNAPLHNPKLVILFTLCLGLGLAEWKNKSSLIDS